MGFGERVGACANLPSQRQPENQRLNVGILTPGTVPSLAITLYCFLNLLIVPYRCFTTYQVYAFV